MKEEINYPNEAFGHCDVGTAEKTCKNCPNYPNECAYMEMTDEDSWTIKSRKFDFKKYFEKINHWTSNNQTNVLTKEEKDLILKVCYSSLLYGITVYVEHDTFYDEGEPYKAKISIKSHQILDDFGNSPLSSKLLVRPYLRPMESMTETEKEELSRLTDDKFKFYLYTSKPEIICYEKYNYLEGLKVLDWLNAHYFDYLRLIEKGLALEATKGMYK